MPSPRRKRLNASLYARVGYKAGPGQVGLQAQHTLQLLELEAEWHLPLRFVDCDCFFKRWRTYGVTVGHNGVIHFDAEPVTFAIFAAAVRLDSVGACDEGRMDGDYMYSVRGRTCLIAHVRYVYARPKQPHFVQPLPRPLT